MLQAIGNKVKGVWKEEDGLGTLEIILIIAVTVVIALLFRRQIATLMENLFTKLNTQTNQFFEDVK